MERIKQKDFEHWIKGPITNEEWKNIKSEIDGRVKNFIDGLLTEIIQDYNEGIFNKDA